MLQQAVATANTALELKAAANAALTTANTELEWNVGEDAKTLALLGEKLRSVHKELKDILPTKVRLLVAIAP
jgi:hypothetical protein